MDRMSKQKFNIIVVVDNSKSMQGSRIDQVNAAIHDIVEYLQELQVENSNIDFYLSILTFSTLAKWNDGKEGQNVNNYKFTSIKAKGYSNLHLAYKELNEVLIKESQGGIMPDFGGVAPIILLLSDGHPTNGPIKEELEKLRTKPWFKVALKYGIAIELNDKRTIQVLRDFVSDNGDVIQVYNSNLLRQIIKIIVLTASKVKSKSSNIQTESKETVNEEIIQEVQTVLNEVDDWEW